MSSNSPSLIGRLFRGLWRGLDTGRRVFVNFLFLILLVVLASALFVGGGAKLEEHTVLVLNLGGRLVEQGSNDFSNQISEKLAGDASSKATRQTRLRDVLSVLDAAAKDPKIERVLLVLDDFSGAGLASLRELAAALERFKASGKQVVAWGSDYDQKQYYLAAHADSVWLHPMGMVFLQGYGGYRNYYRDALDRIGVSANVIRKGAYKNFGEPFFANAPSKETLEADGALYAGLWSTYLAGIEKARKLPAGSVMQLIDDLPKRFAAADGDAAKLALNTKLVDRLMTRDEMRQAMIDRGVRDDETKTFRQIGFNSYLAMVQRTGKLKNLADGKDGVVGVVVAEGEIISGRAPAGRVGGLSTAELIRKARNDDKVKAVVLRVNSPGGSAFGSELIRRELELTRVAGKPVVVSMGDVAASGGYWIAMAADEVYADAATITGSIGVFAMLPTAEKAMETLSINTGGVATTWLVGAYDPRRPLDERVSGLVEASIGKIYKDFTTMAAKARKTSVEDLDKVAQGRVWTGAQALERNLIDKNGGLEAALKAARAKAKLSEVATVDYVEPELGTFERLAQNFSSSAQWAARQLGWQLLPAGMPQGVVGEAKEELAWLAEMSERTPIGIPYMPLTHCLCGR